MFTMKHLLHHFENSAYDSLIPDSSAHAINLVAGNFPPLSGMGLEYLLGANSHRTDLIIRVTPSDIERSSLRDSIQT
jgi:hypothetical protein